MASNSPDLNHVDYSVWSIMQDKVFQTHITKYEYRGVETSAGSSVGRAGPQTYRSSYRTVATPTQVHVKRHGERHCVEFACRPSSMVYLLNSRPRPNIMLNFATR